MEQNSATGSDSSAPVPHIADPALSAAFLASNTHSLQTSANVSDHEETAPELRTPKGKDLARPRLGNRQSSGTMIVPADHPEVEVKRPVSYPPGDARAMSPRRSEENVQKLFGDSRQSVQSHALERQAGLSALLEKVENVKTDHEKLERNNAALHDYIGGLTKSMSKTDLTTGRKK